MRLEYADIENIEIDSPFFFRTSSENPEFDESIKNIGLITPLPAIKVDGKYIPMDGQKLLNSAIKGKTRKIPVLIYDNISIQEAWIFSIIKNGGGKNLSISEKSRIFHHTILQNPNEDFRLVLREIGEYPSPKNIRFFKSIISLPGEIHHYIERYGLSKKQTEALILYPEEIVAYLVNIGQKLAIRPVELIEMTKNFYEIHRAQKISIDEITKVLEFEVILKDESLNRNQKIKRIKDNLHQMRFPLLTEINNKLHEIAEQLPSSVKARWLSNLEKAEFEISLKIRNPADVAGLEKIVSEKKLQGTLEEISQILHGER
jgi:hypothetical protein